LSIYQVDIQKNLGTEYWTNVWHIDVADAAAAMAAALLLENAELGIHYSNVNFNKMLIRPYPVVAGDFVEVPLSIFGLRAGVADLALFNVARVVYIAASGKPGIKMFRGCLNEGDQEGVGEITDATRIYYETWADLVHGDVPEMCKANGVLLGAGRINLNVGMRQLRRGSKRPILP
jgi:hypothetical protein